MCNVLGLCNVPDTIVPHNPRCDIPNAPTTVKVSSGGFWSAGGERGHAYGRRPPSLVVGFGLVDSGIRYGHMLLFFIFYFISVRVRAVSHCYSCVPLTDSSVIVSGTLFYAVHASLVSIYDVRDDVSNLYQ